MPTNSPPHIAVIGSGAAAVGALNGIVRTRPDADITLIGPEASSVPTIHRKRLVDSVSVQDFYTEIYRSLKSEHGLRFPPIKTLFGKEYPRYIINEKKRFFRSEHFGGLTTLWGGTMLPFDEHELRDWPISYSDLRPHYQAIADLVGISGQPDRISTPYEYANRPPIPLLKGLRHIEGKINNGTTNGLFSVVAGINRIALETREDRENHCTACGECMGGCYRGAMYNAADALCRMMEEHKITWIKGEAIRFSQNKGGKVTIRQNGQLCNLMGFDRIFLAAGCPSTTAILMRSLSIKKGPILTDNSIYQLPLLNFASEAGDDDKMHYLSLAGLLLHFIPLNPDERNAHAQIYPNFDYLWRGAVPEPLWPLLHPLIRLLRDRLLWLRLYLHGDYSQQYMVSLDNSGELTFDEYQPPDKRPIRPLLDCLRQILGASQFRFPPIGAPTSSHLASTFPYNGSLLSIPVSGMVAPGVYVCDATCFPDSPAASPTFTIMANASRTAVYGLND
ncbi:MAG: GMC family oxidoreductase [Candidatus Electrothrix sp. LOE1_4_5]|nr:GMC family oxidoreductase [Candidatus Electrothrix gigas]